MAKPTRGALTSLIKLREYLGDVLLLKLLDSPIEFAPTPITTLPPHKTFPLATMSRPGPPMASGACEADKCEGVAPEIGRPLGCF